MVCWLNNDTNVSLRMCLKKFKRAQVVCLGCKYIHTHILKIYADVYIYADYIHSCLKYSPCICTGSPLSNNLLIVRKHLIRTIVPHMPFFPPHFMSFSPLPAHPPLFRFVGNWRCKHVDKWSFESPVTNDIYSATKRLFEWPPWACFTLTLVISCLMAKHLRLSAHPWRRFHEGPYLEIQLRWAFQEALLLEQCWHWLLLLHNM